MNSAVDFVQRLGSRVQSRADASVLRNGSLGKDGEEYLEADAVCVF